MFAQPLLLILILLCASVKYIMAFGIIFYKDYNWLEAVSASTVGAMLGVFVFTYSGQGLLKWWKRRRKRLGKSKNYFNKRNRLIVHLKNKGGIALIAFLTPVLLTIPVGCLVAVNFCDSKKRIAQYMFFSILFWSCLFSSLYHFAGINFIPEIEFL